MRGLRLASIFLPCAAITILTSLLFARLVAPEPTALRSTHVFMPPPVTDRISLRTPAEAARRRSELRRYVFGRSELPEGLPVVERGIVDAEFASGLSNLARLDRVTTTMPLGFTSVSYHVIPQRRNGRLLIYHNGHRQALAAGKSTIAYFLRRGYALLVFAMPFEGFNTNPETVSTRCGRITVAPGGDRRYHDPIACLPFALRYFVEPVVVGINYTRRFDYRITAMAGLSGGGWTTLVSAALDSRIRRSYPVAGSSPHIIAPQCSNVPPAAPCVGDFEQTTPGFYRIANYLELYTLGSWGQGRKQLAINNVYDSCCFAGTGYTEWRPPVQAALRRLDAGTFDAIGDVTHRGHRVSKFTLRAIEHDLRREPSR